MYHIAIEAYIDIPIAAVIPITSAISGVTTVIPPLANMIVIKIRHAMLTIYMKDMTKLVELLNVS